MLRPAYVLVNDAALRCVVLCIRGTQSMKDLFTSLAGEGWWGWAVGRQGWGGKRVGARACAAWCFGLGVAHSMKDLHTSLAGEEGGRDVG